MKFFSAFFLVLAALVIAGETFAQSGRAKPTPTPTPNSISGPSGLTRPTPAPTPNARPTSTPNAPRIDDEEILRVSSTLVPIPVSITDRNGRAVNQIRESDIELLIDGEPAEVGDLTRTEVPLRLAMIFDNSSSVAIARDFERDAAKRFFRRVVRGNGDLAALFSVNDLVKLEQPFTRDVSALTRAIDQLAQPQGATALLDSIMRAADYLRSAQGRRVIVLVSDGEDTYSEPRTTLELVVRELLSADVQVFVLNTKEFENFKRTGQRKGNANVRALAAERRMLEITTQTGGAVHSPIEESEVRDAFERIAAELSQQYIIGYYPEDDSARRGNLRSIEVRIKGRDDLVVRSRKGYYVPK